MTTMIPLRTVLDSGKFSLADLEILGEATGEDWSIETISSMRIKYTVGSDVYILKCVSLEFKLYRLDS